MEIVTLKELGNKLPVGKEDGTRPSFSFKPWRMAEEKHIGNLKQKHQHLGRFVREVFDYMLDEYNGKPWKTIDQGQRKLLLSGQPWANIFYMYVSLRVDALGEEMKMSKFDCGACGAPENNFTADLTSMDVRIHGKLLVSPEEGGEKPDEDEEPDERTGTYMLKKAFSFGEIKVTGIKFGFTPWRAMEMIKQHDRNEGSIKEAMMRASILSIVTEEAGAVELNKEKVLLQLSKRDIEGYYDALDEFNGGPRLAIENTCNSCGHEAYAALNWTFDYFFGNSSL